MTTPHKHAALGIAFFSGKILQYRDVNGNWLNWLKNYCPDFSNSLEWRIKPEEPERVIAKAYEDTNGYIYWNNKIDLTDRHGWVRCPELDKIVEKA